MGSMIRRQDLPDTKPSECEVAPHRYKYDEDSGGDPYAPDWKSWLASVPYHEGDVVYLAHDNQAVRARVLHVYCDYDRYDDRREKFKVQVATKRDTWSRQFFYTWPGFIQRGYKLAGLAPEMPT